MRPIVIAVALIPALALAQLDPEVAQENPEAEQVAPAQGEPDTSVPDNPEPEGGALPVVPVAQEDPAPVTGDAVTLDEVVVTAQRRSESIQDVPLTVNAITGETLEKQGILEFRDLPMLVPGLQLESLDPRAPVAMLRGIAYDPNSNASPTVDTFFSEVAIAPFVAFQSMFDIERVEVLRGAQGTLRGTSPAGAITIAPRKANLAAWDASVGGSFSTNDLRNVQLAGGGPLTDRFGIRVAALSDRNAVDGIHNILTNSGQQGETLAGRVTLNAQLLDSLDATLTYQRLESQADIGTAVESLPGSTRQPHLDAADRKGFAKNQNMIESSSQIAALDVNWHDVFAGHGLNLVTGYLPQRQQSWKDFDFGNAWPAANFTQYVDVDYPGAPFSQGILLTSPQDQAWTYLLGLTYAQEEVFVTVIQSSNAATTNDPETPPAFAYDFFLTIPIERKGGGVFAQTGYQISEKWSTEVGIKLNESRSEQQIYFTPKNHPGDLENVPGLSNIPLIPEHLAKGSVGGTTGTFNLSYQVTPGFLSYFSAAKSFRPGNVNIASPSDLEAKWLLFDKETSLSKELGVKTDWLEGRFRANVAVFHQAFDDYHARDPGMPYDGDRNGQRDSTLALTFNADAIVTGTEAEVAYVWGEHLQFSLVGAYSKAVFDDAVIPCTKEDASGNPQFTDENGVPGQQFARCRSNGAIGSAPHLSMAFTPEYTWPLTALDLFLRGVYKYDGARPQQDGTELPGFGVANLFFGAHNAAQTWEVSVWVKNLLDEVGIYSGRQGELAVVSDGTAFGIQGNAQTFRSGYTAVFPTRPREFGLTFRYNLGL